MPIPQRLALKFRDCSFCAQDLNPGDLLDVDVASEINRLAIAAYERLTGRKSIGLIYLHKGATRDRGRTDDVLPEALSFDEIRGGGPEIELVESYPPGHSAVLRSDGGISITDETGATVGAFPPRHWISQGGDLSIRVFRFATASSPDQEFGARNWTDDAPPRGSNFAFRRDSTADAPDGRIFGVEPLGSSSGNPRALAEALKSLNQREKTQ